MTATTGLRLLVTSVVRGARLGEPTGFVTVVDCDGGRVLMRSPVPDSTHRASDPNPRGGLRGGRGVAAHGERVVVANVERLLIYDASWKPVAELTHRWLGGVHEILPEEDGIWVTCTSADLLVKLSWDGRALRSWDWRGDSALAPSLGFHRPPTVPLDLDYRDPETMRDAVRNMVHLNAVSRSPEGLLLSFGRILSPSAYRRHRMEAVLGRVAKALGLPRRGPPPAGHHPVPPIAGSSWAAVLLRRDGRARILKRIERTSVPNHNLLQVDGSLVYNDSNSGNLTSVDVDGIGSDRAVAVPGNPPFARGLVALGNRRFLVGSQAPAAVYQVDLDEGRVVGAFPVGNDPRESVFGICLIPPAFDDPPERLERMTSEDERLAAPA